MENSYQPERFQLHIFPGLISIFVIFFGHKVKIFCGISCNCCHGNSNLESLNYYFCICITDIDCVKYVENYSYFVMLEGGSLHRICLFVEYAIFCEIADYMMFWLPW